jgi:hypothetical protein
MTNRGAHTPTGINGVTTHGQLKQNPSQNPKKPINNNMSDSYEIFTSMPVVKFERILTK